MACSIRVHNSSSQDYYYLQIICSIIHWCNNLVLCFFHNPNEHCTFVLFKLLSAAKTVSFTMEIILYIKQKILSVMLLYLFERCVIIFLIRENIELVEITIMSVILQITTDGSKPRLDFCYYHM